MFFFFLICLYIWSLSFFKENNLLVQLPSSCVGYVRRDVKKGMFVCCFTTLAEILFSVEAR